MTLDVALGDESRRKLLGARLAAGLMQARLARRIGTKPSVVSRLDGGDAEPSFDMFRWLAAALNVSFKILPIAAIVVHDFKPAYS